MYKLCKNLFKRHKKDETGATTVEFMIVMPLIVFWFGGSFTFFDAYSEWTRSVKATYTVADILSRQTQVNDEYIEKMNRLFANIMDENSNNTWVRVSSIQRQSDGTLAIEWSEATGLHTRLLNNDEIPEELIPNILEDETVIVVESYMNFIPFQAYIGIEARTLTKKVAISPRFTSQLINTDHT
jgi:Flp pilus assembly protein TadG